MIQKKLTQEQLRYIQAQLDLNAAKLEYIKAILQIDDRAKKKADVEAWARAVLQQRAEYEKMVQQRAGTKTRSSSYYSPSNMKIIVKK